MIVAISSQAQLRIVSFEIITFPCKRTNTLLDGFGGADKVLLIEFSMPSDPGSITGTYAGDMPAIWMLNAQIPRTTQYGPSNCNCWQSGCGE
jgi:hypothetical protein